MTIKQKLELLIVINFTQLVIIIAIFFYLLSPNSSMENPEINHIYNIYPKQGIFVRNGQTVEWDLEMGEEFEDW